MSDLPFRTLVVVPGTHSDGSFEQLCGGSNKTGQVKCKRPSVIKRAVQLDLRPQLPKPHQSLFIAWSSRVVHQGHTHNSKATGYCPPLLRPQLFAPEKAATWRAALNQDGYVVLADILPISDVEEALSLLLKDIRRLRPELQSLAAVRESHLPPSASDNDLRDKNGLCHGEFAWYLRTHRSVSRIFEQLFDLPKGAAMTGSVDVVALAPPGMSKGTSSKQWLHLDYTPPQGQIWQCTLQLFPCTAASGSRWERIAVMICKAPAGWSTPQAEQRLLACCVTGAASRATAGVTLGLFHKGSEEHARCCHRLLPELSATAVGTEAASLTAAVVTDDGSIDTALLRGCCILRQMSVSQVMQRFPARELRHLVPTRVRLYISSREPLVPADLDSLKWHLADLASANLIPQLRICKPRATRKRKAPDALGRQLRQPRRRASSSSLRKIKSPSLAADSANSTNNSFGLWPGPLWPGELKTREQAAAPSSHRRCKHQSEESGSSSSDLEVLPPLHHTGSSSDASAQSRSQAFVGVRPFRFKNSVSAAAENLSIRASWSPGKALLPFRASVAPKSLVPGKALLPFKARVASKSVKARLYQPPLQTSIAPSSSLNSYTVPDID